MHTIQRMLQAQPVVAGVKRTAGLRSQLPANATPRYIDYEAKFMKLCL